MGCDVATVSTDSTSTHRAWRQDDKELAGVACPMGSDPAGTLSRLFGVYDENSGRALRGTFIISPEGVLLGSEVNFYNLGRNIDELMRKFKANIYLARKPGEVCPSKWKDEGDETPAPGVSSGGGRR
jgi:peroxiredoxin (alkyl hydroperoxide reductase subunit C)